MQINNISSPILVTGASGFLASHLIKLLLEKGFKVRGTVLSLINKPNYDFLYNLFPEKKRNLELVEASLDEKRGWSAAVEGCEYVFHAASPLPRSNPSSAEDLVKSALNGTKFVLEACLEKGVKKIVVTSSAATMSYGTKNQIITEEDWSNERLCSSCALSKVKAEKLVWDFYERNKDQIQVAVINPVFVLGPVFHKAENCSMSLVGEMLKGNSCGAMDVSLSIVDVRDVAEAHFQAMFRDEANGKRYITSAVDVKWRDIINVMKAQFEKKGYVIYDRPALKEEVIEKETTMEKALARLIGISRKFSNKRSIQDLSLTYHSLEESVTDMANSLVEVGLISMFKKLDINREINFNMEKASCKLIQMRR